MLAFFRFYNLGISFPFYCYSDFSETQPLRLCRLLAKWSRKQSLNAHIGMQTSYSNREQEKHIIFARMGQENFAAFSFAWLPAEEGFVLFYSGWYPHQRQQAEHSFSHFQYRWESDKPLWHCLQKAWFVDSFDLRHTYSISMGKAGRMG